MTAADELAETSVVTDVIQETATRIHRGGYALGEHDAAMRLATRIAINISVDLQRRSRVLSWSQMPDDIAAPDDVERTVVARGQLAALCERMSMTPDELERLISCEPQDRTASAKSRRYRSRQRLRRVRDTLGGLVGIPKLRWFLGGAFAAASVLPAGVVIPFPSNLPSPAAVREQSADPEPVQAPYDRIAGSAGSGSTRERPVRASTPTPPTAERSPAYESQLEIWAPNGAGAEKGTREYPDGSPPHVACIRQAGPLDDVCVPHPLRD